MSAEISNLIVNEQFSTQQAAVAAQAEFAALPTAFVEAVAEMPGLAAVIGPSIQLNAVANLQPTDDPAVPRTGEATVEMSAARLEADAAVALADAITLRSPANVRLTLTPEGYQALMRMRGSSAGGAAAGAGGVGGRGGQPVDRPEITPLGGSAQRPEARSQRPEARGQRSEGGDQGPEVAGQTTESLADALALREPAELEVVVNALRVPQPFEMSRTAVEATLSAPMIAMVDQRTGEPATLRDLSFALSTPGLAQRLSLNLQGVVDSPVPSQGSEVGGQGAEGGGQGDGRPQGAISRQSSRQQTNRPEGAISRNPDPSPGPDRVPDPERAEPPTGGTNPRQPAPEPGPFTLAADLTNLFNEAGELNIQGLTADVQGDISGIPVLWINRALGLEPSKQQQLAALLGPMIGGTIDAELSQMTGPLSVNLIASNMRMPLDAQLSGGQLTLNQDLRAEVDVTPDLGNLILRNVNPLLISTISSPEPIALTVRAEGFAMPIESFEITKISVPEATLELGELVAENRGPISGLLGLMQKIGGLANLGNELGAIKDELQRLRFSPLTLRLENGVAQYERVSVTLLGPAAEIATSGQVLWVNPETGNAYDVPRLDMVITLGSGLFGSLGLEGLDEAFSIPIPMTGTTTEPKIDFAAVVPQMLQQMPDALINKVLPDVGEDAGELLEGVGKGLEGLLNPEERNRRGGSPQQQSRPDSPEPPARRDRREDPLRQLFEGLTQPREQGER